MEKLMNFLKQNAILTIATCKDEKPRASILEYIIINDRIMFATDGDSIKGQNLAANNRVSISLGGTPIFATIDGTARIATEEESRDFDQIQFKRHPELLDMINGGLMKPFTYFVIEPEIAYFSDYTDGMTEPNIIKF